MAFKVGKPANHALSGIGSAFHFHPSSRVISPLISSERRFSSMGINSGLALDIYSEMRDIYSTISTRNWSPWRRSSIVSMPSTTFPKQV